MADGELHEVRQRFDNVVSPARTLDACDLAALPPVMRVLAFPLPVGSDDHDVLAPNARAFRDLNVTGGKIEERAAFELSIALCENHNLGTPLLKRSVIEDADTFQDLREMMYTQDKKLNPFAFENATSAAQGSTQYNPRVAARYLELRQRVEDRHGLAGPEGGDSRGGGRASPALLGGNPHPDLPTTREQGELHVDLAALLQQGSDRSAADARRAELEYELHDNTSGWAEAVAADGGESDANSSWNDALAALAPSGPVAHDAPPPHGPDAELPPAAASLSPHERAFAMTQATLDEGAWSTLDELRDKLTILYAAFHDPARRDTAGKPQLVAALKLILVHDPVWNSGSGVTDCDSALRKLKQLSTSRFGGGQSDATVADLQFRYRHLPPQNVLHYLDQAHYRALCQTYVGSSTPLPKDERDVALRDHAAHPARIFTLERALQRLRESCDESVHAQFAPFEALLGALEAQESAGELALGPVLAEHVESTARPLYQLDHADCVWMSRAGTGLAVQFLPWEDGVIKLPRDPDDSEAVTRAIDALEAASAGARVGGSARAGSNADLARALTDGSGDAPATLPSKQREAVERQIMQFRASTHASSYAATRGNALEVNRADLNWCVAMGERYAPVRAAFQQAALPVPGANPATSAPTLRELKQFLRARERECAVANDYREAALRLFESQVWKPDAYLTDCMSAVVQWHRSGGEGGAPGFRRVSAPIKIVNRHCDLLGNLFLHEGLVSRFGFTALKPRELCMMRGFVLDAYDATPQIGNNYLATGPAGVGKSFMLELLLLILIAGTVVSIMSETTFANADDADRSDHISIYDEMPYHMVASGNGRLDKMGQGSRFKSMLTTGHEARRTLEIIKTASGVKKRVSRLVHSWGKGCVLIASNISTKDVEGPLLSRFYHSIHADTAGDAAFLGELQAASGVRRPSIAELRTSIVSALEERQRAAYIKMRQTEQTLVAAYHKVVQAGALDSVTMVTCDLLIGQLLLKLQSKGVSPKAFRNYERVYNLAKQHTVMGAVAAAFRNQYGADWRNHEWRVTDQKLLVPYLFCTKQAALLAFTFLADDFINPMQGPVLRALYKMAHFPADRYRALAESEDTRENAVERLAGAHRNLTWRALDEEHVDLNYLSLKGTFYDVARLLRGHMKIKPSVDDIVSILQDLSATLVTFDAVDEGLGREELHQGGAGAAHLARARRSMPAVMQERSARGGGFVVNVCVEAMQLIRAASLVREAIGELAYQGMRPQTYVLGMMSRADGADGHFDTLEITPAMCAAGPATFRMRSGDFMQADDRHRMFSPFLSMDADDYDARGRLVDGPLRAAFDRAHQAATALSDTGSQDGEDGEDDEDDELADPDAMDVEEEGLGASGDDEEEDAEIAYEPEDYQTAYEAIRDHLNQGRAAEHIEIREDLDDYAALVHFVQHSLPLALHEDPAVAADESRPLSQRVRWRFRDPETGRERRRPLPTSAALIAQVNEGLAADRRAVQAYNKQYEHASAAVRAAHQLPVPTAPAAARGLKRAPTRRRPARGPQTATEAASSASGTDATLPSSVAAGRSTKRARRDPERTSNVRARKRARIPNE